MSRHRNWKSLVCLLVIAALGVWLWEPLRGAAIADVAPIATQRVETARPIGVRTGTSLPDGALSARSLVARAPEVLDVRIVSPWSIPTLGLDIVLETAAGPVRYAANVACSRIELSDLTGVRCAYLAAGSGQVSTERIEWAGQGSITLTVMRDWSIGVSLRQPDGAAIAGHAFLGLRTTPTGRRPLGSPVAVPAAGGRLTVSPQALDDELVFYADAMVPVRTTVGALFGRPMRNEDQLVSMQSGGSLRGRVVAPSGAARSARVNVHSLHCDGTLTFGPAYSRCNGGLWADVSAEEDGSFLVSGIGAEVTTLRIKARAAVGEAVAEQVLPWHGSSGELIVRLPD